MAAAAAAVSGNAPAVDLDFKGLVSTVAGDGVMESKDGTGTAARFNQPHSLCRMEGGPVGAGTNESLLICDTYAHRIRRLFPSTARVLTLAGTNKGFKHGSGPGAAFSYPWAICSDPKKPGNYYVADWSSIRYSDGGTIVPIAGGEKPGFADGVLVAAQFNTIYGIACTRSRTSSGAGGERLYTTDSFNHRIRMIELKTCAVSTVCGDGKEEHRDGTGIANTSLKRPRKLAFDRSPTVTPDTILYITAPNVIRKLNIATGQLSTIKLSAAGAKFGIDPYGIDCTPTGMLVVTCRATHAVYMINPNTGDVDKLAGAPDFKGAAVPAGINGNVDGPCNTKAKFDWPVDVQLIDAEQCAYVCEHGNNRIRKITLPPSLFITASKWSQRSILMSVCMWLLTVGAAAECVDITGAKGHEACDFKLRSVENRLNAELHSTRNDLKLAVGAFNDLKQKFDESQRRLKAVEEALARIDPKVMLDMKAAHGPGAAADAAGKPIEVTCCVCDSVGMGVSVKGCNHQFCESCFVQMVESKLSCVALSTVKSFSRLLPLLPASTDMADTSAAWSCGTVTAGKQCQTKLTAAEGMGFTTGEVTKRVEKAFLKMRVNRNRDLVKCMGGNDCQTMIQAPPPDSKEKILTCPTCNFKFCNWCKKPTPNATTKEQCITAACKEHPLLVQLKGCGTKSIGSEKTAVQNVPKLRLCPTCGLLTEHTAQCKVSPSLACVTCFVAADHRLTCWAVGVLCVVV